MRRVRSPRGDPTVPKDMSAMVHRMPRWAIAAAVVAAIAAATAAGLAIVRAGSDAGDALAPRTAAQLLAAARASQDVGLSGTVLTSSQLDVAADSGAADALSAVGVMTGARTARVWYGGPDRQRIAMADSRGEVDYFRSGTRFWRWDRSDRAAAVVSLPDRTPTLGWSPLPRVIPGQLAAWALGNIDAATTVTVIAPSRVAGRPAYTLRVVPSVQPASPSLIGEVTLELDAQTSVALAVTVRASDRSISTAVQFTSVRFDPPDQANFSFTVPPDTVVGPQNAGVEPDPEAGPATTASASPDAPVPVQAIAHGDGWGRVVEFVEGGVLTDPGLPVSSSGLRAVSGTWGSGRLFTSPLVSLLITQGGRVFVGAVPPERLFDCV